MTDVESRIAAVVERTTTLIPDPPKIAAVRRGAARRQRRHRLVGAAAGIALVGGALTGALALRGSGVTVTAGPSTSAEPSTSTVKPWPILPSETLGLQTARLSLEDSVAPPDGSNEQVFSAGPDGPRLVAYVYPNLGAYDVGESVQRLNRTLQVAEMPGNVTLVVWQTAGGLVQFHFSGLSRAGALDIAEDLELRVSNAAGIDPRSLPPGWESETDQPVSPSPVIQSFWGSPNSARLLHFTAKAVSLAHLAMNPSQPGSKPVDVAGNPGLLYEGDNTLVVTWYRDGIFAELIGTGVTETELLAVARSVGPITEAQRQQLAERNPVVDAVPAPTSSGSAEPGSNS